MKMFDSGPVAVDPQLMMMIAMHAGSVAVNPCHADPEKMVMTVILKMTKDHWTLMACCNQDQYYYNGHTRPPLTKN